MRKELTKEFVEITETKPFTLTVENGFGVEIATGETTPTKNTGKIMAMKDEIYIQENVKVWARAIGNDTDKATISIVGF